MSNESTNRSHGDENILTATQIKDLALKTLEDNKGLELKAIKTDKLNDLVDWMIFASGSSTRHVKSLTDYLAVEMKRQDVRVIGVEGKDNATWTLVDLGDVLIHIMQKEVRDYYQLEKLWSTKK